MSFTEEKLRLREVKVNQLAGEQGFISRQHEIMYAINRESFFFFFFFRESYL